MLAKMPRGTLKDEPGVTEELDVLGLALEISLSLDHPMMLQFPELEDCRDLDEVVFCLRRILLAESA